MVIRAKQNDEYKPKADIFLSSFGLSAGFVQKQGVYINRDTNAQKAFHAPSPQKLFKLFSCFTSDAENSKVRVNLGAAYDYLKLSENHLYRDCGVRIPAWALFYSASPSSHHPLLQQDMQSKAGLMDISFHLCAWSLFPLGTL